MNTLRHEELYRKKKVMDLILKTKITVCGAGAIGSNLIDNMIRQGFKEITVIDFDRVEDHNRHTQIFGWRDIGQLKTTALKNNVYNSMNVVVKEFSKKLDESNIKKAFEGAEIIIDGFDNVNSRKLVTDYCKQNKRNCLHIGLFQDYAEVIWNEKYRVPDDVKAIDVCEYPLARNIILLAVSVATECIYRFIEVKDKKNFVITLNDMKIVEI